MRIYIISIISIIILNVIIISLVIRWFRHIPSLFQSAYPPPSGQCHRLPIPAAHGWDFLLAGLPQYQSPAWTS